MDLRFNTSLAEGYKSGSQIARVLTEDWLASNMYVLYVVKFLLDVLSLMLLLRTMCVNIANHNTS